MENKNERMNDTFSFSEPITGRYEVNGPKVGGRRTYFLSVYKGSLLFRATYVIVAPRITEHKSSDERDFNGTLCYNELYELFKVDMAESNGSGEVSLFYQNKVVAKITLINYTIPNITFNNSAFWRGSSYPIDKTKVVTTADKTIVPKPTTIYSDKSVILADKSTWKESELGFDEKGKLGYEIREDIATDNKQPFSKILNFFTITDIHITDKEAPNQLIYLEQLDDSINFHKRNTSVYSPIMPYTPHVLDAVVQTINTLHENKTIEFDLGISLGDACNHTQNNEANWYIDILKGGLIRPSSGKHLSENTIDYQKPFITQGLNKDIPWYQTVGNHDMFFIGSVPIDNGPRADLRNSYLSDTIIRMGDVLAHPNDLATQLNESTYSVGTIDGNTDEGKIICQGENPTCNKVAADDDRYSLRAIEWMKKFKDHGFPEVKNINFTDLNNRKTYGCYVIHPTKAPCVKIIILDDIQREDDGNKGIHGHGFLDAERWEWLQNELDEGTKNNELMIIAAHAPIGVEEAQKYEYSKDDISPLGWADFMAKKNLNNEIVIPTEEEILAKLYNTPNVLMWIAGHRHYNTVSLLQPSDNNPLKSFWQVETSSLRDFPQQFRTFELSIKDEIVSIKTTDVDYAMTTASDSPTAKSRKYAIAAQQIVNNTNIFQRNPPVNRKIHEIPESGSYNAILLKKINPELAAKLKTTGR